MLNDRLEAISCFTRYCFLFVLFNFTIAVWIFILGRTVPLTPLKWKSEDTGIGKVGEKNSVLLNVTGDFAETSHIDDSRLLTGWNLHTAECLKRNWDRRIKKNHSPSCVKTATFSSPFLDKRLIRPFSEVI